MRKLIWLAVVAALAACGTTHDADWEEGQTLHPVKEHKLGRPLQVSAAETGFGANPDVAKFVDRAVAAGYGQRETLQNFFSEVVYRDNIIRIMERPSTSRPWYEFRKNHVDAARITNGQRFYEQNRQIIDRVAAEYGVPSEILVAIVGIETNYGRNMGSFRVADALATLGFGYPRRSEFFQNELQQLLEMSREEGRDPFDFSGSYAGAMGMPQFMPSSYRKWAVDYDRDGLRNIWSSVPDVAASVANYLRAHGWKKGQPMMIPVNVASESAVAELAARDTEMDHTVADLRQLGVELLAPVGEREKAVLFRLEVEPNRYEYYIGLNNFYSVWKYNNSRLYVAAVREIANGIGSGSL